MRLVATLLCLLVARTAWAQEVPSKGQPLGDKLPGFSIDYNRFSDSTTLKGPRLDKMMNYARLFGFLKGHVVGDSVRVALYFEYKDIGNEAAIAAGPSGAPFKQGGQVILLLDGEQRDVLTISDVGFEARASTPVYKGWAEVPTAVLKHLSGASNIEVQFWDAAIGRHKLSRDFASAAETLLTLQAAGSR